MSVLNLDGPSGRKSGKSLKVLLGIGGLAAVVAIASTLAANISINSGPVEFGQGVSQTAACDDQITVTPYSTFINDSSTGSHKLSSIKVSGIDSTEGKCSGKTFVIKAYGEEGMLDLLNYSEIYTGDPPFIAQSDTYTAVEITNYGGSFVWTSGGTDGDDVFNDEETGDPRRDLTETSFTVDLVSMAGTILRTPLASAEDVQRITVETKNAINAGLNFTCDSLPNDAPSYYPCGPQLNVPVSALTSAGWTPCFSNNYNSSSTLVSDALASCTDPYLAVFGKEVGDSLALLLAVAPRDEIFTITDGNTPRLVNGTYWYYTPVGDPWTYDPSGNNRTGYAQSLGFAPDGILNQDSCDASQEVGDSTSPYRLCWHIEGDEVARFGTGYRLGIERDNMGPNTDSGNYLRVIYQHPGLNP